MSRGSTTSVLLQHVTKTSKEVICLVDVHKIVTVAKPSKEVTSSSTNMSSGYDLDCALQTIDTCFGDFIKNNSLPVQIIWKIYFQHDLLKLKFFSTLFSSFEKNSWSLFDKAIVLLYE